MRRRGSTFVSPEFCSLHPSPRSLATNPSAATSCGGMRRRKLTVNPWELPCTSWEMPVVHAAGMVRVGELGSGLILRALVDDLAVIHVKWCGSTTSPRGTEATCRCWTPCKLASAKANRFRSAGVMSSSNVDRMNWLLALAIATTVAKRLPASGETSQKDVSHDSYPSCNTVADRRSSYGFKHDRPAASTERTLDTSFKN